MSILPRPRGRPKGSKDSYRRIRRKTLTKKELLEDLKRTHNKIKPIQKPSPFDVSDEEFLEIKPKNKPKPKKLPFEVSDESSFEEKPRKK